MANGFLIAHHLLAGNTADESTLQQVLTGLQERSGIRHIMIVSDSGLVSPENLQFLSEQQFSCLLCIGSRRSEQAQQVPARLDEHRWQQVDEGNQVQEIHLDDSGNDELRKYDRTISQVSSSKTD